MPLKRLIIPILLITSASVSHAQFHWGFNFNSVATNPIPTYTTDLFVNGESNIGYGVGSILGGRFFKHRLSVNLEIQFSAFKNTPDIMLLQGSLGYTFFPYRPLEITPSLGAGSIAYISSSSNEGDNYLNPGVTFSYAINEELRLFLKTGYGHNLSQAKIDAAAYNGYTFWNFMLGIDREF